MVHRETGGYLEASAYLARTDIDFPGSTGREPGIRVIVARLQRMGGISIARLSPI